MDPYSIEKTLGEQLVIVRPSVTMPTGLEATAVLTDSASKLNSILVAFTVHLTAIAPDNA